MMPSTGRALWYTAQKIANSISSEHYLRSGMISHAILVCESARGPPMSSSQARCAGSAEHTTCCSWRCLSTSSCRQGYLSAASTFTLQSTLTFCSSEAAETRSQSEEEQRSVKGCSSSGCSSRSGSSRSSSCPHPALLSSILSGLGKPL